VEFGIAQESAHGVDELAMEPEVDLGESLPGTASPSVLAGLSEPATRIRELSVAAWGPDRAVEIVGRSPAMEQLLRRISKIAKYDEPVLVLGESGVGKEALAQAIYLLGPRARKPFVVVNCPQYQEGNLTVSELFGHRKGSFTGALDHRRGCFETADGGAIFLDEIGDLHMSAQVMLLRALASGEFQPLGADFTRRVSVRVVAATNRSLNELAANRQFRRDLIFRLRYFQLEVPPLRDRGDDWRYLADHYLQKLYRRYGVSKRFSEDSLRLLAGYPWPGNVRELITVTTTGYALSDGNVIEPRDFVGQLEDEDATTRKKGGGRLDRLGLLERGLRQGGSSFWEAVQEPFLERDLNRLEVRALIARGLRETDGSYRQLLDLWHIDAGYYQKFMDFLRHHRLKPKSYEDLDA
jgi:transcriptional regulator with GAF, ATPase, and Fis domain